ncbi:MAG: hypothetical protein GY835_12265 [bacterium]|nr:hypothetical protein [bacterium]
MIRLILTTSLLLLIYAVQADALPFDTVQGSARGAAMAGMNSVVDRNAAVVFGNPARLGALNYATVQMMTRDWYNSGIRSWSAAYARPLGAFGLGIGWHRFGLNDLWTEDAISLAGAWTVPKTPITELTGHVGGAVKLLQVAAPGYEGDHYQGDFRLWAVDLSLLMTRGPFTMVWAEENLACADMTMLEGGQRYRGAPRKHRGGLSYRWRDDLLLACEYRKQQDFSAEFNIGFELSFYSAFYIRGGGSEHHASAGFGLRGDKWDADGAFESRGKLGTSLIFSLTWNLGVAGGER